MYIIDSKRFEKALKDRGYQTIGSLAKDLGVHRNTIHYYLSGQGVFPAALEKMLSRLELKPSEILVQKEDPHFQPLEVIAPLVTQLQHQFPSAAFVLFGSRARQKAQKYSDWDIGVFDEKGLSHNDYRTMNQKKGDFEESLPYAIDLVNLHQADDDFLRQASKGWIFLGGSLKSWLGLNKRV